MHQGTSHELSELSSLKAKIKEKPDKVSDGQEQ